MKIQRPGVLTIVLLMLMGTACQGRPPVSPAQGPPSPTQGSPVPPPTVSTLSGVVYESTVSGRRALAGVAIDVSPEYQYTLPQTTTDAEGHYEVSGRVGKIIAGKVGYLQPCRTPTTLAINGVLDVYLVSDDVLSTTGVPASMPIVQPTLSGLVFEQTPQGARPIPGATLILDFSGGMGWAPSAATRSDATGQYMLCGVTDVGFGLLLGVSAEGYLPVEVLVDGARSVDIELKPAMGSQRLRMGVLSTGRGR